MVKPVEQTVRVEAEWAVYRRARDEELRWKVSHALGLNVPWETQWNMSWESKWVVLEAIQEQLCG